MRRVVVVVAGAVVTVGGAGIAPASAAVQATRVSLWTNPAPALVGDEVVLVGKLERRAGTSWTGLGAQPVRLAVTDAQGRERAYLGTVISNADGTYTRTVRAPLSGYWSARYQPASGDGYGASATHTAWYALHYQTAITGYMAGPRVAGLGTTITVQGRVTRRGATATGPLAGATVGLYWAKDGKTWHWTANTTTNGSGGFVFRPRVMADGYWATVLPAASDNLSATSGVAYVDGRFRTRVGLSAKPSPVRRGSTLTLSGTLQQVDATGKAHPLAGRWVRIYIRTSGSKVRLLGTVKTGKAGTYAFKYRPLTSARFETYWPGDENFLRSVTSWRAVKVRR
ncbi:hypothetical protein [Actinomadura rupiterrae]|uniref:hypothetical protein n=1 Tax=Actinomadura rupiterrae TaxID=559627 RepID=UPI0020A4384B|nr:hypothetical protein [Actinomadura rupiterrae]MCP2341609.1 hypothetical protein [Actinomadura rupiterrae]